MRHRHLIVLAVITTLFVLCSASTALAGGPWAVHNNAGAKVGSTRTVSTGIGSPLMKIFNASGTYVAVIDCQDGTWAVLSEITFNYTGILRHPGTRTWLVSGSGGAFVGRARLSSGHWILQKRVGGIWKRRGSVSGHCPGKLAAGALRTLLW